MVRIDLGVLFVSVSFRTLTDRCDDEHDGDKDTD
jgi:hypothetical protein